MCFNIQTYSFIPFKIKKSYLYTYQSTNASTYCSSVSFAHTDHSSPPTPTPTILAPHLSAQALLMPAACSVPSQCDRGEISPTTEPYMVISSSRISSSSNSNNSSIYLMISTTRKIVDKYRQD
jgi:hypothetical protein